MLCDRPRPALQGNEMKWNGIVSSANAIEIDCVHLPQDMGSCKNVENVTAAPCCQHVYEGGGECDGARWLETGDVPQRRRACFHAPQCV